MADPDDIAEMIAKAVYEKAQPKGVPWRMLKDDERERWLAGGRSALARIWQLDREP